MAKEDSKPAPFVIGRDVQNLKPRGRIVRELPDNWPWPIIERIKLRLESTDKDLLDRINALEEAGAGGGSTVEVGTTTTLAPGSSATVENSGSGAKLILNFGIPQGLPGKDGKDGADGAPGRDGVDGAPGRDGSDGAPGEPGPQGEAAGFGTPLVEVDSGVGTPSCRIEVSGSNAAKIFHFFFSNLKGEPGEQGAQGNPGEQGEPGEPGRDGEPGAAGADGAPGASAGFGEPVVTVDGEGGEPKCVITASGPDTAKIFTFAFSGLKGEKGEPGEAAVIALATPESDGLMSSTDKSKLDGLGFDSNYVHINGNEGIFGKKIFYQPIKIYKSNEPSLMLHSGSMSRNGHTRNFDSQSYIDFTDTAELPIGRVVTVSREDGGDEIYLVAYSNVEVGEEATLHKLGVVVNLDGSSYAFAPTPPANAPDNAILTKGSLLGPLTDQYVNSVAYYNRRELYADTMLHPMALIAQENTSGLPSIPDSGSDFYYILQFFYDSISASSARAQLAVSYKNNAYVATRFFKDGAWSEWVRLANQRAVVRRAGDAMTGDLHLNNASRLWFTNPDITLGEAPGTLKYIWRISGGPAPGNSAAAFWATQLENGAVDIYLQARPAAGSNAVLGLRNNLDSSSDYAYAPTPAEDAPVEAIINKQRAVNYFVKRNVSTLYVGGENASDTEGLFQGRGLYANMPFATLAGVRSFLASYYAYQGMFNIVVQSDLVYNETYPWFIFPNIALIRIYSADSNNRRTISLNTTLKVFDGNVGFSVINLHMTPTVANPNAASAIQLNSFYRGRLPQLNLDNVTISGSVNTVFELYGGRLVLGSNIVNNATGRRYTAHEGSFISTGGKGADYVPGSTAGTIDSTSTLI